MRVRARREDGDARCLGKEKQVARIQAETVKKVADIARATAAIKADTVRKLATAEAGALACGAGGRGRVGGAKRGAREEAGGTRA